MSLRLLPTGGSLKPVTAAGSPVRLDELKYENSTSLKFKGKDNLSFGTISEEASSDEEYSSSVGGQNEEGISVSTHRPGSGGGSSRSFMLNDTEQSQLKKFLSKFVRDVTNDAGIAVHTLQGRSFLPTVMRMNQTLSELSFDVYTEGVCSFTEIGTLLNTNRGTYVDTFVIVLRDIQELIMDDALAETYPELVERNILKNAFEIVDSHGRHAVVICDSEREKRQYVSAVALFRIVPNKGTNGDAVPGRRQLRQRDLLHGLSNEFPGDDSGQFGRQEDGGSSASCRVQANIRKVLAQQQEQQRLEGVSGRFQPSPKTNSLWRYENSKSDETNVKPTTRYYRGNEMNRSPLQKDASNCPSPDRRIYHHQVNSSDCVDYHSFVSLNEKNPYFRSKVRSISSMRCANRPSLRQVAAAVSSTPPFHALANKPQGTGLGLKAPEETEKNSGQSKRGPGGPFRRLACCDDACRGCNKDQANVHPEDMVSVASPGFAMPIGPESGSEGGATCLARSMDAECAFGEQQKTESKTTGSRAVMEQFEPAVIFGRSAPSTTTRGITGSPLGYPISYPPSASTVSFPKSLEGLIRTSLLNKSESHNRVIMEQSNEREEATDFVVNAVHRDRESLEHIPSNNRLGVAPGFLQPVSPFHANSPCRIHFDINGYVQVDEKHEARKVSQVGPGIRSSLNKSPLRIELVNHLDVSAEEEEVVSPDMMMRGRFAAPTGSTPIDFLRSRKLSTSSFNSQSTHTTSEASDSLAGLQMPKGNGDDSEENLAPSLILQNRDTSTLPLCNTRLQSVESVRPEILCAQIEPSTPYATVQHLGLTQDDFVQSPVKGREASFTDYFHQDDMTDTSWAPHLTNQENTLTLLHGEDQATNSGLRDLHRQQAIKMLESDAEYDNFSVSPSQLAGHDQPDIKALQNRKLELMGRHAILGPGVAGPSQLNSSLLENKPWQKDLDSMSPLEKLRKASKYGTPTPFTQIQFKRLEEEASVANMSNTWTRHER